MNKTPRREQQADRRKGAGKGGRGGGKGTGGGDARWCFAINLGAARAVVADTTLLR